MCVLLMTSLSHASVAFAEAGTGAGSPGVAGQKPIGYLGTTLVDGGKVDNATDVPVNPKLKVGFDKNVVNSLIWTTNSQSFSMKSGNNEAIPIKVTKVDDTVDFSQRQVIFVESVSPLKPGTSYQLIISPNLTAKNGVVLGKVITVGFKTKGEALPQVPPTTTPIPKPVTPSPSPNTPNSSSGKTTVPNTVNPSSTADLTKPSISSESQDQSNDSTTISPNSSPNQDEQATPAPVSQSSSDAKKSGGMSATTIISILGAVLLAAWITVEIIARKKRK